jgi:hypothetical protein
MRVSLLYIDLQAQEPILRYKSHRNHSAKASTSFRQAKITYRQILTIFTNQT